jgi:hypothetical protein
VSKFEAHHKGNKAAYGHTSKRVSTQDAELAAEISCRQALHQEACRNEAFSLLHSNQISDENVDAGGIHVPVVAEEEL